jgi:hypothetical protein
MTPRSLLLLSIVPLLAVEPGFSSAAGHSLQFNDPQLAQQLQQAEDLARQAGEQVFQSLQTLERDLPRYGVPFFDQNGNIVIPRRNPALPEDTPMPAAVPNPT